MNYKTYADLSIDILQNIYKIPSVDLIVGIPRSGMIPAYMIGAHLNLPVITLSEFLNGDIGYQGQRPLKTIKLNHIDKVLVLDDSIDSGFAMSKARREIDELKSTQTFYYAAVYASTEDSQSIDFYFQLLKQPRFFQWNYKNHFIATKSCYDIDGVLCVDPTDDENDDARNYACFLENAKPLYIPKRKISCLVTSRLEKYRKETEDWLSKNNIHYGDLVMMNIGTAKERRALGNHGKFKGEIYKNRNEELFVESSWEQAKKIFEISNKMVVCTENDVCIKNYLDIINYERTLTQSSELINSESIEVQEKYEQLSKNYYQLQKQFLNQKRKFEKILNNKWYKISNLSRCQKLYGIFQNLLK